MIAAFENFFWPSNNSYGQTNEDVNSGQSDDFSLHLNQPPHHVQQQNNKHEGSSSSGIALSSSAPSEHIPPLAEPNSHQSVLNSTAGPIDSSSSTVVALGSSAPSKDMPALSPEAKYKQRVLNSTEGAIESRSLSGMALSSSAPSGHIPPLSQMTSTNQSVAKFTADAIESSSSSVMAPVLSAPPRHISPLSPVANYNQSVSMPSLSKEYLSQTTLKNPATDSENQTHASVSKKLKISENMAFANGKENTKATKIPTMKKFTSTRDCSASASAKFFVKKKLISSLA